MHTFDHLIREVLEPGLCHHCGGCVTFCTAVNFGALTRHADGTPGYADRDQCIECGICTLICPEMNELDDEMKKRSDWAPPMGRVLLAGSARAADEAVRKRATDGGVVTALLLHLFDMGRIDGAIVTHPTGLFRREPHLAATRRDILDSGGFYFDASHGMSLYSEKYSTFSPSIQMLGPMARRGLRRVAFVGTPCQVKTIRKMEALGVVPTDAIAYIFGLFCSGNFLFGADQRRKLEEAGGFEWGRVRKINVKDSLMVHLDSGEIRRIPLDELAFMRRYACRFCEDYAAEHADLSFGGVGSEEGWTTVVARTPLGRAAFVHARSEGALEGPPEDKAAGVSRAIDDRVHEFTEKKRVAAKTNRDALEAGRRA